MSNNTPSTDLPPVLLSFLLLTAMITCSSAGVVFAILTSRGVPPALAASWRLWCQEIVIILPFLLTYRDSRRKDIMASSLLVEDFDNGHSLVEDANGQKQELRYSSEHGTLVNNNKSAGKDVTPEQNSIIARWVQSLPLTCVSGIFLGLHFSSWVYSIEKTTLAHSLLWVSMGPIIINWGQWLIYLCGGVVCSSLSIISTVTRPTNLETWGALIGLAGAMVMLLDVTTTKSSETDPRNNPTLEGDLYAFFGAFAVSIYLLIGRHLRSWMPLWLYAFPVVGCAAITSLCLAFLDSKSPATIYGWSFRSAFGFFNKEYFLMALYLGAGPGVCGHTVINLLLKYMSPLTISTAMLSEPLLGSLLGYFFGLQPPPGKSTWIGGLILLLGLFLITKGEADNDIAKTGDSDGDRDYLPCTTTEMPLKDVHQNADYGTLVAEILPHVLEE